MKLKIFFLLACFLGISGTIAAQTSSNGNITKTLNQINEKQISGQVLDEQNEPVIGATVMVQGTTIGTATDVDGQFVLLTKEKNPVIQISYVGYKTVTIALGNNFKFLKICLEPEPTMMETVVVTGYQNIKRESATGSYQVIKASDLDKRTVSNLSDNLEGQMPGLVKNTKSTSTDEDAFTVRGVGTFQAATKPLVVVDGLPIEGGMSTVNPYDIENITLLKDAAAASIYGARASNGVLVITTKRAKSEKLTVDFNADVQISERQDYKNMDWINASDLIDLELLNWEAMVADPRQSFLNNMLTGFLDGRMGGISPVTRLLAQNHLGQLSDNDLNTTLDSWRKNDYRREYRDIHDRIQVDQRYNISLRTQGKIVNSSINASYSYNNMGVQKENSNELSFKYRGEIKAAKWLDVTVGLNLLNRRSKTHDMGSMANYSGINSFLPYQSMYNADGSLAAMEGEVYLGHEAFSNPNLELKDCSFNLVNEMERNFSKYRYTNTRSYINALFKLLPGWTASANFQYEDIFSRTVSLNEADSYLMRMLYSGYTTGGRVAQWEDTDLDLMDVFFDPDFDWANHNFVQGPNGETIIQRKVMVDLPTNHHIPAGALRRNFTTDSQFYTFRAQTDYNRTFLNKHEINALAGFEYRQTHTTSSADLLYGYDDQTQSNLNLLTDWSFINTPTTGVFGDHYTQGFAPSSFNTSDVLHRFYSVYFNANYIYDNRYGISGSWRLDKTDLFGTDPKFRGRPLWSVGATWNAHNESFMHPYTWVNALKVRASYGLTGNIDSSVSSYLMANLRNNMFTGDKMGSLISPPNDQLRWEKTSTVNVGVDFSFFNFRLNGSLDFYRKDGSDILTSTDLDRTTGWGSLTINSGKVRNTGLELQLDGRILTQKSRKDVGVNLGFNIAWNDNKVVKINHYPKSGYDNLTFTLHEGYPLNSLFSFRYDGIVENDGIHAMQWLDKDGQPHTSSIGTADFKIEDTVFSGSATPKVSGSITPEVTWQGFTLSAMMAFYAGHYMRAGNDAWYTGGGAGGYNATWGSGGEIPASALNYWRGDKTVPANGYSYYSDYQYFSYANYRDANVYHADYLKFRNVVLTYNFEPKVCRAIGLDNLRLRFQMNNLGTWARNPLGLDPEAVSESGYNMPKVPRSYTIGLYFSL